VCFPTPGFPVMTTLVIIHLSFAYSDNFVQLYWFQTKRSNGFYNILLKCSIFLVYRLMSMRLFSDSSSIFMWASKS
jgi:hypothetical protein